MTHSAIGRAPEEKYHHGKSPASWAFMAIFLVATVVAVFAMIPRPNIPLLIVSGVIALAGWIVWGVLRRMGRDNV